MIIGAKLISIFGGDKKCKYTQCTYVCVYYVHICYYFCKKQEIEKTCRCALCCKCDILGDGERDEVIYVDAQHHSMKYNPIF